MSNNFNNFCNPMGRYIPNSSYYQQLPGYSAFNNFQDPSGFQQQMIPGHLVNNLDEITPQEVPMDGSVSLFPQNDYSAIYAKTWTKDGTIATVKYVPEPNQAAPQKTALEARLDKIDQRFDKLERMLTRNNKPYRKHQPIKKEGPVDG